MQEKSYIEDIVLAFLVKEHFISINRNFAIRIFSHKYQSLNRVITLNWQSDPIIFYFICVILGYIYFSIKGVYYGVYHLQKGMIFSFAVATYFEISKSYSI